MPTDSSKKENRQRYAVGVLCLNLLEAALWAFYKTNTFEDGCLLAVNLGEDADTTGAIYGQLAGTYYGLANIPHQWVNKLVKLDLIESVTEKLLEAALNREKIRIAKKTKKDFDPRERFMWKKCDVEIIKKEEKERKE